MRLPVLLFAMPALAGTPLQVKVHVASVTSGAGREPKGAMEPARFRVELSLAGAPKGLKPDFRVWRVQETDRIALERGASPAHLRHGGGRLAAKAEALSDGRWALSGTWPELLQDSDRLLIEVWRGKRRLGWTLTALQEQLRPEGAPRPERSGN